MVKPANNQARKTGLSEGVYFTVLTLAYGFIGTILGAQIGPQFLVPGMFAGFVLWFGLLYFKGWPD